jgi:protein-tyrosine phosphatase
LATVLRVLIDLHCHLLPGLDDGPPDLETALAQARAHVASGVQHVVCTPHVNHGYANDSARIADAVAGFQHGLDEAGIALRVSAGAEVSLSRAIERPDDELSRLHLAGGEWLLLEPPLGSDVPRLADLVRGLQSRGHKILVAHPERCAGFHHDGRLLADLVENGAAAQVTAGSLAGGFGRTVQRLAVSMVRDGLINVVASDAHDPTRRGPGLAEPLEAAGFGTLVEWSCSAVPAAIVGGGDLPERPASAAAPRRRRLFGR